MRELHGVICSGRRDLSLKQRALLFDKFHLWQLDGDDPHTPDFETELDFLRARQVVYDVPPFDPKHFAESLSREDLHKGFELVVSLEPTIEREAAAQLTISSTRDLFTRYLIKATVPPPNADITAICELPLPQGEASSQACDVIAIGLSTLPVPDDSCAWDDLLHFKAETHDKQWGFRRFLDTLASKNQTEAEIRDDIEWSLNEYTKAMNLHKLKTSNSFIDVFVISPLEIIEDLVKINWSKIAKGALQVKKRKVALLEAEMKAPGRECAYVFDARKKFGNSGLILGPGFQQ
ncbi:MAG TPA: hypothetical protein VKU01_36930 [Bryobacteraceae bacterium]|nr:hypothetical protein [Bryobacteraceae bacterium]